MLKYIVVLYQFNYISLLCLGGEEIMNSQLIVESQTDNELKNEIIEKHIPLVIHTVSNVLGRYVCTYNSTEYSVGLLALDEAINKYNPDKGSFSNFATLIIRNRVIDEIRKEKNHNTISLEDYNQPIEYESPNYDLKEEIEDISKELQIFNISFEDLVESSPKHYDTRNRCMVVSEKSSKDENIIKLLYKRLKLPVKEIINKFRETKRFLYSNKSYITCLIIIFYKDFENIKNWVIGTIKDDQNGTI
jgi:RNA polymerase sigma factor